MLPQCSKHLCRAVARLVLEELAPTLVAARTTLPPKGALAALGRPGDGQITFENGLVEITEHSGMAYQF